MLKIGPSGGTGVGRAWDHESRTEIAQLIISRSANCINYIHFVYVEDGGNKLVMSEKIGVDKGGSRSLNTIMLDYPREVITGVTGKYRVFYNVKKQLTSLTFVTNKRKYGPFEVSEPNPQEFDYHVGEKQFGGFFGTSSSDGIESIGIYLKPLQKLPVISSIKTE